jgi:hypothetical protein
MTGESGRDDYLIEYKGLLFLPRYIRELSLAEKADAYRRLAVIHKASIPEKRERVLSKNKAKKELESNELLNEFKNPDELENKIQETKQAIRLLSRRIRMFEKDDGIKEEKAFLEKILTSKQERLNKLKKFLEEGNLKMEKAIEETGQLILDLKIELADLQKIGYKEKIRLEAEKKSEEKKLETLEIFLEKVTDIMAWQKYLELSKKAILISWFSAEGDEKALELAYKIHGSLIAIEND